MEDDAGRGLSPAEVGAWRKAWGLALGACVLGWMAAPWPALCTGYYLLAFTGPVLAARAGSRPPGRPLLMAVLVGAGALLGAVMFFLSQASAPWWELQPTGMLMGLLGLLAGVEATGEAAGLARLAWNLLTWWSLGVLLACWGEGATAYDFLLLIGVGLLLLMPGVGLGLLRVRYHTPTGERWGHRAGLGMLGLNALMGLVLLRGFLEGPSWGELGSLGWGSLNLGLAGLGVALFLVSKKGPSPESGPGV